jgi:glycosyltransferase 2 family protein
MSCMELQYSDQLFGPQLIRKLVPPLLLGVVAYAVLLLYGDATAVAKGIARLPLGILALGVLLSLASFALRGLRWILYLKRMQITVPFLDVCLVFMVGLGMSITPGKLGELLKSLLLKQHHDVPIARSMPILFAERLTDLAALLVLGEVGFLWQRFPAIAVGIGVLGLGSLFALGRARWPGRLILHVVSRVPRLARYAEKLVTAQSSLYDLWAPKTFVAATALSIMAWGLQAAIIVVFSNAFGVTTSVLDAAVAYSAPLLAGTLALLPGGLGLTEASMTGALRTLSGMSAVDAAALTILIRGVTFWLAVVIGFSSLYVFRRLHREA